MAKISMVHTIITLMSLAFQAKGQGPMRVLRMGTNAGKAVPRDLNSDDTSGLPYKLSYQDYNETWVNFKLIHGKTYGSAEEERMRFSIFLNRVKSIEDHNLLYHKGFVTYWKAINFFSDLEGDSRSPQLRRKRDVSNDDVAQWCNAHQQASDKDIPNSVDWRGEGYVTDVKNQKTCGACWAFATTGALEGQWYKKTGRLINLSEQQLVDCDEVNEGCCGGNPGFAFDHIRKNGGIMSEEDYPYVGVVQTCSFVKSKAVAFVKDCKYITPEDEEALKKAVAEVGPIVVSIEVTNNFVDYGGGIFQDETCGEDLNHAVLVVGYGSDRGGDYWIVKNGWGIDWGENGYIRMRRNYNNMCGVASEAVYPVAAADKFQQSAILCLLFSLLSIFMYFSRN